MRLKFTNKILQFIPVIFLGKKIKQLMYSKIFLLAFVLMFATIFKASAIDFYWKSTGRADQNFTNAANWESAPGSGIPANGALAPSSVDDVFFPSGNLVQTVTTNAGSACRNFNVLAAGVITFSGTDLSIYGNFSSNGKHMFGTGNINFLGTGNHTINMGDNAVHSNTASPSVNFDGTGTYTLLSDLNLPHRNVYISNTTFIANGFALKLRGFVVRDVTTGTKTVNLANSTLMLDIGIPNVGALVFQANPATTTYNFNNAEIYINTTNATGSSFFNVTSSANGTVINGVKSLNYTETITKTSYEELRVDASSFTFNVIDFNINVSKFNVNGSGTFNLNATRINLLKPVRITSSTPLNLTVNAVTEPASCTGQSSLWGTDDFAISFKATAPIVTSSIAFKVVNFSGAMTSMPVQNDLGQNTGTYTTTTAAAVRQFYWVGGTGNWNDPTRWSLAGSGGAPQTAAGCLPTLNDDVFFDANSFTATGQTVTIAGNVNQYAYARNIYWTDPNNRGKLAAGTLNVSGSADYTGCTDITSGIVYVGSGINTVKSGSNFTYASSSIIFQGIGTYTLTDDLICGTSTVVNVFSGTFNSNGKAITAYQFYSDSRPALASNQRNINIANSVLTLSRNDMNSTSYPERGAFFLYAPFLNSFNAAGSTINITGNTYPGFVVSGYNAATVTLNTITFNDINFTANAGSDILMNYGVLNFVANNVSFGSNATIIQTNNANFSHKVNTYNLSAGKTYIFTPNSAPNYTIVNGINTPTGSCVPLVVIKSSTAGTRVKLYKAGLPFIINNAAVQDINASGATLTIAGGQDLGNNLNVNIVAPPSQNFYWVGDTGDWNDASHWSIGVSGGNPSVTNPGSCIPSLVDDVFFDGNSFTATNQTVTIDNDATCRNMLWDTAVNSKSPVFAGTSSRILNTYGAVTLASGMTFPFSGTWNMKGTSLTTNANAITTNGIRVYATKLYLMGGGRYDLLDDLTIAAVIIPSPGAGISFTLGQFYTNGHHINADGLSLIVTGTNKADISNSVITLNKLVTSTITYNASHSSAANWNATGSTINANYRYVSITVPANVTIDYGKINMNPTVAGSYISSGNSGTLRFTDVNWLSNNSTMTGNFVIGNLTYATSSNNSLNAGKTITVTNKLTANGTPCNPIRFYSSTAGTPSTLTSTLCNFDLKFARLTDITAGGSCTAAQNKVVGDDVGGNSNWTFSTISAAEYLGSDKVLTCNEYPYTLTTAGFNQDATSYLWNDGSTGPDLVVTGPGTYRVTVTYGAGCTLTDEIVLGLTPNPVLNLATLTICETGFGSGTGGFNLNEANAQLVATPANYTFTYHNTLADAAAGVNTLPNAYTSITKTIYVRVLETATGCFSTKEVNLVVKSLAPAVSVPANNLGFCEDAAPTIADLQISQATIDYVTAMGAALNWYNTATGGTAIPGSTLLANGDYYASITGANICESVPRTKITVTFYPKPTADAGADQKRMGNYPILFTMAANNPVVGVGKWIVVSGDVTINNINDYNTTVTLNSGNSAELQWQVSTNGCVVTDNVMILKAKNAVMVNPGLRMRVGQEQ